MKISAFRIVKEHQSGSAWDGEGARRYSGRWNSEGTPVVYTAGSRALAALEMLVHLNTPLLKFNYVIIEVQFDSQSAQSVPMSDLPPAWRSNPPAQVTQFIGDQWIKSKLSAILAVPSAIIPEEFNYLLNPRHPDFAKIKVSEPQVFSFDTRLISGKR